VRVDGVALEGRDAKAERALRRRLPPGVRMYTGNAVHCAELIDGDDHDGTYSDALLGFFAAIAPAASAALSARAAGDRAGFPRDPGADRAAGAPHRRRRRRGDEHRPRVPRLAERPPGPLRDGRRPPERRSLPHLAELLRLADAADCSSSPSWRSSA
jgi:hypothetical protein